jgi:phospholipid transport system substrate-binding protein
MDRYDTTLMSGSLSERVESMECTSSGMIPKSHPTKWRWSCPVAFWCLAVMLPGIAQGDPSLSSQGSTLAVQRTMNEILYILTELKDASRSTQRLWEIEQVVRRSFNYEEMAERSIGEAWQGLSASERRQYVRLFVQLLRDEVADKLREYSPGQVAYLSEEGNDEAAQVLAAPAGANVDARIEFQVVRRSGAWIMNDLVCDGMSIVTNYRSQFARILRDGSFLDLMEHMKQQALLAKVTEKVDS